MTPRCPRAARGSTSTPSTAPRATTCSPTSRRCSATARAAEDVTASAFERAYRKQRTYKAAPRHRARLAVRHRPQRRARRAAPPQAQRRPDRRAGRRRAARAEDAADAALRRAALRTALAALAPRERELIALKFHAGLDNAELAAVLGVSVSNAGTLAAPRRHEAAKGHR